MKTIFIPSLLLPIVEVITLYPYCFRFTWVGPFQDKQNIKDLSCSSLLQNANDIPCRQPIVATDNDALPDTEDLWKKNSNLPDLYGCPMTPGVSCVKVTYIYNTGVQNITYMCAKVNASDDCYTQRFISGLDVSVCVCKSELGQIPCNASIKSKPFANIIFVVVFITLLKYRFSNKDLLTVDV